MPTLVELCGRQSWALTPLGTGSLAPVLVEPGQGDCERVFPHGCGCFSQNQSGFHTPKNNQNNNNNVKHGDRLQGAHLVHSHDYSGSQNGTR